MLSKPSLPSTHPYRIFIGKIHLKVNEETLRDHFSQFGGLEDVEIKRHAKSKVSKRFGFINCSDKKTMDKILSTKHSLLGAQMNCNIAFQTQKKKTEGLSSLRKVFLNGITKEVTDARLSDYFEKYGEIVKVYGVRDASDKEPRGFGFIEFCAQSSTNNCIGQSPHSILGITISAESYSPNKQVTPFQDNSAIMVGSSGVPDIDRLRRGAILVAFDGRQCSFQINKEQYKQIWVENAIDKNEGPNLKFNIPNRGLFNRLQTKFERCLRIIEPIF